MHPSVLPAPAHDSIAATLRKLPPHGRLADSWRAAACAVLRLNPRECAGVGAVFEDVAVSDDLRMTALDLLSAAGSFEAQVVIRRLLSLAIARRHRRTFAAFVQRLGQCECPDGPTLRFLMSIYAESRSEPHDVRAACAFALGNAAGRALASGDAEMATRASDVLRRDLMAAVAPLEKGALATALGNAGLLADAPLLLRLTQDLDPNVRCAAALALRKFGTREARARIVTLLTDVELRVAQSAATSLLEHQLDDEDYGRLAEVVLAGLTSPAIDGRLLQVLVRYRPRALGGPSVENALRLILGRLEVEPLGSGERRIVPREGTETEPRVAQSAPPAPPSSRPRGVVVPSPSRPPSGASRLATISLGVVNPEKAPDPLQMATALTLPKGIELPKAAPSPTPPAVTPSPSPASRTVAPAPAVTAVPATIVVGATGAPARPKPSAIVSQLQKTVALSAHPIILKNAN